MSARQMILEPAPTHRVVITPVPTPRSVRDSLDEAPVRAVLLSSLRRSTGASAAASRLLLFWKKYRWYREHGDPRTVAREKAWWHAREAPCPLVTAMRDAPILD